MPNNVNNSVNTKVDQLIEGGGGTSIFKVSFFGRSESCFIAFASLARFTEITRHNIVIYFPHINPYEILSRVSLTVNEGSSHTPDPCSNCYLT